MANCPVCGSNLTVGEETCVCLSCGATFNAAGGGCKSVDVYEKLSEVLGIEERNENNMEVPV